MRESLLQRLIAAHTNAHMVGWDFSRLEGRVEADSPDWDLDGRCFDAVKGGRVNRASVRDS